MHTCRAPRRSLNRYWAAQTLATSATTPGGVRTFGGVDPRPPTLPSPIWLSPAANTRVPPTRVRFRARVAAGGSGSRRLWPLIARARYDQSDGSWLLWGAEPISAEAADRLGDDVGDRSWSECSLLPALGADGLEFAVAFVAGAEQVQDLLAWVADPRSEQLDSGIQVATAPSRETATVVQVSRRPARFLLRGDVARWGHRDGLGVFFYISVLLLVSGHLVGQRYGGWFDALVTVTVGCAVGPVGTTAGRRRVGTVSVTPFMPGRLTEQSVAGGERQGAAGHDRNPTPAALAPDSHLRPHLPSSIPPRC